MAYGVLYEFRRTSSNGADMLITISQKDYTGAVKKRALGRAPVIKRENNDHIYGTSCELYAECLVDGEFSHLYTSDAYEFKVEVYKNNILLWAGFVSPELYSEPDIAPPYDVQIIATDGLGELKNYNFKKRGVASILDHLDTLMANTGLGMDFYVVSGLRYINADGTASEEKDILSVKLDLDHEEGNSCYEVLQGLLSSLNANITQHNGRYLIFRETDFISKASATGVEAFSESGSKINLPIAGFGSMMSTQWWPVGQLSTVIEPAKNHLTLKSPNHYKENVLSFDNWSLSGLASYSETDNAYVLPGAASAITQTVNFGDHEVGYRLGLRVRARNVGTPGDEEQNIGIKVEIDGRSFSGAKTYWLQKLANTSGRPLNDYWFLGTEGYIEEDLPTPTEAATSSDAQDIDIVLPLHRNAIRSYMYAKSVKLTIFNPMGLYDIHVYDVSLVKYEQIKGYEANVIIENMARESESDIDLTITAGDLAPAAGDVFMTGLPMRSSDSEVITKWQIGLGQAQDYLAAMAFDYSRAISLPRMKYSGILNVPGSATILPTLFLRDGTYYFPRTYSYDLYADEITIDLISISAADVSLSSVQISQTSEAAGTMGTTTGGSAEGGSPSAKSLAQLDDVRISNPAVGDIFAFGGKEWENMSFQKVVNEYLPLLKTLGDWFYKTDDGLSIGTKYNLFSEQEMSANGLSVGPGGSGSGLISQVYGITAFGTIAAESNSATFNAYAIDSLYKRIVSLEGKATAVSFVPAMTSGKQIGTLSIDGVSTVLYGVDAYSKADADGRYLKLSGGEINGYLSVRHSTSSIALGIKSDATDYAAIRFTGKNGNSAYLIYSGTGDKWEVSNVNWARTSVLLHSNNYSQYALPLTGGTISGNTYIPLKVVGTSVRASIGFSKDASAFAYLTYNGGSSWAVTNEYYNNEYTLIHSGNIGSQSVASATDLAGTYIKTDQSNANNAYIQIKNADGKSSLIQILQAGTLCLGSSYSHFAIKQDGTVGIGTTDPKNKLDVAGSLGVGTSGSSDIILKRQGGYSYITATTHLMLSTGGEATGYALGLNSDKSAYFYGAVTMSSTLSVANALTVATNVQIPINGDRITFCSATGTYTKGILAMNTSNTYLEAPLATDSASGAKPAILIGWRGCSAATGTTKPYPITITSGEIALNGTTAINGTLKNVNNIYPNSAGERYIGTSSNPFKYMYAEWYGAGTGQTLSFGANNAIHIFVNSSGNVTIGSSDLASTTRKLFVGNSSDNFSIASTGSAFINTTNTSGWERSFFIAQNGTRVFGIGAYGTASMEYGYIGPSYDKGLMYFKDGNIGIGTISPEHKLHVNGNVAAIATDTTPRSVRAINTNGAISLLASTNRGVYDSTKERWLIVTDGTNSWLPAGNVGIGASANEYHKLYVHGGIYADGNIALSNRLLAKSGVFCSYESTCGAYMEAGADGTYAGIYTCNNGAWQSSNIYLHNNGNVTINKQLIVNSSANLKSTLSVTGLITASSGVKVASGQALTFLDASGKEHKLTYDSTAGAFKFDGNILVLGDGQFNAIN